MSKDCNAIKIGICDDETYYLKTVKKLIEDNLKALNVHNVEICCYNSGERLCRDVQFLETCRVIFLDINMQDCNGVEIGYRIKQKYPNIYLVFVTAYMDYVLMGYRVEAFRFLLKDNLEDMMGECIPSLFQKFQKDNDCICCSFVNGEKILRISNIEYIESFLHKMCYHTNVGIFYEQNGNLSQLEKKLRGQGFCRIHKSFLVNMKYVDTLERYRVRMESGTEIPIPREKYQKVREQYFKIMGEM